MAGPNIKPRLTLTLDDIVRNAAAASPAPKAPPQAAPQVVMVERESASPGRDALMGAYAERVAGYGGFRRSEADQGRNPLTGLMSEKDWRSAFPSAPQSQSRGMSDYWEAARSALYGPQNRTTDQMKAFRDRDPLFQRAGREAEGANFMGELRLDALKDYYQMNKRAAYESFARKGFIAPTTDRTGFGVSGDMRGAAAAAASPDGRFIADPRYGYGYSTRGPTQVAAQKAVVPGAQQVAATQSADPVVEINRGNQVPAGSSGDDTLKAIGLSAGTEGRVPNGVGGVAGQRGRRTGSYYAGQSARESLANAASATGLAANDAMFSVLDFIRAMSGKDPANRFGSPLTRSVGGLNTLGR